MQKIHSPSVAFRLVLVLGLVSLFADMTYESARSITGQYLEYLGASGTIVGMTAGIGALIGYGFRLLSGYLCDRSARYWSLTFLGYTLTLFAVPLLALAGHWLTAVVLLSIERLGKGMRTPARDAILSYATQNMGRGLGFGLHEALDQIGAIFGPLLIALALYYHFSYQSCFLFLLVPAIFSYVSLLYSRSVCPTPQALEKEVVKVSRGDFSRKYWLYVIAVSCFAAGYADFSLIAFHFAKSMHMSAVWIPIFFAIAMGADGVAALVLGRWYDKKGIAVVGFSIALSAFFVPCVFVGSFYISIFGMILWGIGMGAQESIIRAVVADLVSKGMRGRAYGWLNLFIGLSWFVGSSLLGVLYDVSIKALIFLSMAFQVVSFLIIERVRRLPTESLTK